MADSQKYFTLLTDKGKYKIAKAAADKGEVKFSYFAIGDGNGQEVNPTPNQTALVHEVWRTQLDSVEIDPKNPAAVIINAIIPHNVGGWWMREFGLFDIDGDMLAVVKPAPYYKATSAEGQLEDVFYEFQLVIGEQAQVVVLVDPSILWATREYVETRRIPAAQFMNTPWLAVKALDVVTPPTSNNQGDTYLVPQGAKGDWKDKTGQLAEWNGKKWNFMQPQDGHGIGLPEGKVFIRVKGVYQPFDLDSSRVPLAQLNRAPFVPVTANGTTTPPTKPAIGDAYIIGAQATGVWAGYDGQLAEWTEKGWMFTATPDGHGIGLADSQLLQKVGGQYQPQIALDSQSGKWLYAEADGTANALTATLNPEPLALTVGMTVHLKIATNNTGAVTLNVNRLGERSVFNQLGNPLIQGDLLADSITSFVFDGLNWRVFVSKAEFVQNFLPGDNGWQMLPSGLLMQWGKFSGYTNRADYNGIWESSAVKIQWPISFPNKCFGVVGGASSDVLGGGQQEQSWFIDTDLVGGVALFASKTRGAYMTGGYIVMGF